MSEKKAEVGFKKKERKVREEGLLETKFKAFVHFCVEDTPAASALSV